MAAPMAALQQQQPPPVADAEDVPNAEYYLNAPTHDLAAEAERLRLENQRLREALARAQTPQYAVHSMSAGPSMLQRLRDSNMELLQQQPAETQEALRRSLHSRQQRLQYDAQDTAPMNYAPARPTASPVEVDTAPVPVETPSKSRKHKHAASPTSHDARPSLQAVRTPPKEAAAAAPPMSPMVSPPKGRPVEVEEQEPVAEPEPTQVEDTAQPERTSAPAPGATKTRRKAHKPVMRGPPLSLKAAIPLAGPDLRSPLAEPMRMPSRQGLGRPATRSKAPKPVLPTAYSEDSHTLDSEQSQLPLVESTEDATVPPDDSLIVDQYYDPDSIPLDERTRKLLEQSLSLVSKARVSSAAKSRSKKDRSKQSRSADSSAVNSPIAHHTLEQAPDDTGFRPQPASTPRRPAAATTYIHSSPAVKEDLNVFEDAASGVYSDNSSPASPNAGMHSPPAPGVMIHGDVEERQTPLGKRGSHSSTKRLRALPSELSDSGDRGAVDGGDAAGVLEVGPEPSISSQNTSRVGTTLQPPPPAVLGSLNAIRAEEDWENEVARNILSLYRADLYKSAPPVPAHHSVASLPTSAPAATHVLAEPGGLPRQRRSSLPKLMPTGLSVPAYLTTSMLSAPSATSTLPSTADGSPAKPGKRRPSTAAAAAPAPTTPATQHPKMIYTQSGMRLAPRPVVEDDDPILVKMKNSRGPTVLPAPGVGGTYKAYIRDPSWINIAGGGGGCKGNVRMKSGLTPIWYGGGGGSVSGRAVWCGLMPLVPGAVPPSEEAEALAAEAGTCPHKVCEQLAATEAAGKFIEYVEIVHGILVPHARRPESRTEVLVRQWRQLIVVCNVFAVKYIEDEQNGRALDLLQLATSYIVEDGVLSSSTRKELNAFVKDSYGYYYFRRGKVSAALQSIQKAMVAHSELKQWDHVAKCHLHTALILAKNRKHGEALRCLGQILQLVDDERLEVGGTSAQKICMVAVAYHNIAVEHMALKQLEDACVASQNSRRLARLSLSYSNRYLQQFEATHNACLQALYNSREIRDNLPDEQREAIFKQLASNLYA